MQSYNNKCFVSVTLYSVRFMNKVQNYHVSFAFLNVEIGQ